DGGRGPPTMTGMTSTDPTPARSGPTWRQLRLGRVAAGLVALEALVVAGFAVFYLYELVLGEGQDLMIVIMSVVTMVVFVIGLAYTAKGVLARHPRAQAPAIAFNFLLVPLGISLFQFAPWWLAVGVLVLGVATVVAVFLMGRLGD